MVKSSDPRLFEQAIFIMKEEAFSREDISAEQVLREARQVADGYVRRNRPLAGILRRLPAPVYAAAGALAATVAWALGK